MLIISPSILAADFTQLGKEVDDVTAGGAQWIHFDVMDGMFVPNISVGLPVLKSLRKKQELFLDVHLMIERPSRYIQNFLDQGADMITLHVESDSVEALKASMELIHKHGKKCGITLKPGTPVEEILELADLADMTLVMTVEPGFGGQKFMVDQVAKIETLREHFEQCGRTDYLIEVDGGIDAYTAPIVVNAGANVLVAGSSVFGKKDRAQAIKELIQCKAE